MGKNKNLVIVESPAKAKTINKFLGKNFQVESCYGHIKDLPKKKLGVDIENGFKPTYQLIPGKRKIIRKLKDLSKTTEKVYLATDLDREGEAIAWHLSQELDHTREGRIVFNQITKKAVQEAIKNPSKINISKVDAQQGRRVLDRLVGYKLSPLLWEKVKRGLSAGRVQSVAVRLICEREKKIEEFVSEEYWTIMAKFAHPEEKISLEAKLSQVEGKTTKILNEDEARKLAEKIEKEKYKVIKVKKEKKERSPYPPFITSTLQQAASHYLKFSTSQTMKIAQDLYEGQEVGEEGRIGLITYMRTDSVRVAREAELEAREYLKKEVGSEFIPTRIPHYKNKKSSQDAHEAIRPTSIWRTPKKTRNYLSDNHFKLYELIWRRFLASQMKKAILSKVTVSILGGKYLFQAEEKKIEFPGFMTVYKEKSEKEKNLPPIEEGEKLKLRELTSEQHFTQPPSHYTEASLVKALEEKGIGRPSTYAPTIATIKARGYVRWQKGRLIPTLLAKVVNDLLVSNFSTILDTRFTAQMEEGLDAVEEGEKKWTVLVRDFYHQFNKDLNIAKQKMRNVKKEGLQVNSSKCEQCGGKMVLKFGRYGAFLACSNYPECKNTREITGKTGIKCPLPDCGGEIVERTSKKGAIFYGCSKFPQCRFVSQQLPIKEICPYCKNPFLLKDKDGFKCPQCGKKIKDYRIEELKLGKIPYKVIKKTIADRMVG